MKSYKTRNIQGSWVWFISANGKPRNVCKYADYSSGLEITSFKLHNVIDREDILNKRTVDSKLIRIMYENNL